MQESEDVMPVFTDRGATVALIERKSFPIYKMLQDLQKLGQTESIKMATKLECATNS